MDQNIKNFNEWVDESVEYGIENGINKYYTEVWRGLYLDNGKKMHKYIGEHKSEIVIGLNIVAPGSILKLGWDTWDGISHEEKVWLLSKGAGIAAGVGCGALTGGDPGAVGACAGAAEGFVYGAGMATLRGANAQDAFFYGFRMGMAGAATGYVASMGGAYYSGADQYIGFGDYLFGEAAFASMMHYQVYEKPIGYFLGSNFNDVISGELPDEYDYD